MPRNYAALPYEYLREMQELDDAEFGRLCRALLVYSSTGEEIAAEGNERFFAQRVMMQEDRFQESYADLNVRARNAANARWRKAETAEPPKPPETAAEKGPEEKPAEKNTADNAQACPSMHKHDKHVLKCETETETKTETKTITDPPDGGSNARATAFHPPTVEEVEKYCKERRNSVDPARFVDFYASKGWFIGKNKMRDWKAAVRTWERDDSARPAAPSVTAARASPGPQNSVNRIDYAEFEKLSTRQLLGSGEAGVG